MITLYIPVLSQGLILTLSCCCSVAKSCPTLCYPMDSSTPGLPVPQPPPGVRPSSCPFNSQRAILFLSDSLCHSYSWQFRFLCVNAIIYTHVHVHPFECFLLLYPSSLNDKAIPHDHIFKYLFICLHQVLVAGMWDLVPWPGSNPGPLHWEHRS